MFDKLKASAKSMTQEKGEKETTTREPHIHPPNTTSITAFPKMRLIQNFNEYQFRSNRV